MIGLLVDEGHKQEIIDAHFDGAYTYFAIDGFTYGSSYASWPSLAAWAEDNSLLFVPCVGPGYIDTEVRPWNNRGIRLRDGGAYYDQMFSAALRVDPAFIGITSFNEWHEGTQIEPASSRLPFQDYSPETPNFYLRKTAAWIKAWNAQKN